MGYQFNEFQSKWLAALESGEYQQAQDVLHDGKGFCCLGLGCKIVGIPFTNRNGDFYALDTKLVAPPEVVGALKLRTETGSFSYVEDINDGEHCSLAEANDAGCSFKQLAAFIRSNPTAVFVE